MSSKDQKGDELLGKVLGGKYKIKTKLGRGGMGMVYTAEHEMLGQTVALKVLHTHLSFDEEYLERFRREAQAACKIKHPNVVTLHDYGVYEGLPYLVMEFIEGENLKDILEDTGAFNLNDAYTILKQITSALAEAHSLGIIHRDLKPENIMISTRADGSKWVHILDFGIAKFLMTEEGTDPNLTKAGSIFGSPKYMAPEQAMGKKIDQRTDIYALGVTTYELLTGKPPFDAKGAMEIMYKHMSESPVAFKDFCPDKTIPRDIEELTFKLLAKDRDERIQTAEHLQYELDKAFGPSVTTIASPSQYYLRLGGVAALFLGIFLIGASYLMNPAKVSEESQKEQEELEQEINQLKILKEKQQLEAEQAAAELDTIRLQREEEELRARELRREVNKKRIEAINAQQEADRIRQEAEVAAQVARSKKEEAAKAEQLKAEAEAAQKLALEKKKAMDEAIVKAKQEGVAPKPGPGRMMDKERAKFKEAQRKARLERRKLKEEKAALEKERKRLEAQAKSIEEEKKVEEEEEAMQEILRKKRRKLPRQGKRR